MNPHRDLDQEATLISSPAHGTGHGPAARRLASRSVAAIAVGALLVGAAAPSVLATGRGAGDDTPAAVQAAGDNETVIAVAEQASPAIVTIQVVPAAATSSGDDDGGDGGQGDDEGDGRDPFGGRNPFGDLSPFEGFGPFLGGTGSGVIVDADGLILTNRHVVDGADKVTVILADGNELEGTVAGVDTYTDFALVKVDAADLPSVDLGDSSALRLGQLAVAIGNPSGRFPGTVSSGIVSGLDRSIDVADMSTGGARLRHLIQTDAAINPGNSGGALLDGDGRLIGINTAVAGGAQGIGFALPIDIAKPIIEQVRAGEPIARPWMGVTFQDIDAQVAKDEDLPVTSGAWIHAQEGAGSAVVDGSPAADAGIQGGDIVTALGGTAVDREHPLDLLLLTHGPGDTVTVTVLRDGASQELELVLGTRPADLGR